jgi:hypothetical protein
MPSGSSVTHHDIAVQYTQWLCSILLPALTCGQTGCWLLPGGAPCVALKSSRVTHHASSAYYTQKPRCPLAGLTCRHTGCWLLPGGAPCAALKSSSRPNVPPGCSPSAGGCSTSRSSGKSPALQQQQWQWQQNVKGLWQK